MKSIGKKQKKQSQVNAVKQYPRVRNLAAERGARMYVHYKER